MEKLADYNIVRCTTGSYNWFRPEQEYVCVHFRWRSDAPDKVKAVRSLVLWEVGRGPDSFPAALDAVLYIKEHSLRYLQKYELEWLDHVVPYLEEMSLYDGRDDLLYKRENLVQALASLDNTLSKFNSAIQSEEASKKDSDVESLSSRQNT